MLEQCPKCNSIKFISIYWFYRSMLHDKNLSNFVKAYAPPKKYNYFDLIVLWNFLMLLVAVLVNKHCFSKLLLELASGIIFIFLVFFASNYYYQRKYLAWEQQKLCLKCSTLRLMSKFPRNLLMD